MLPLSKYRRAAKVDSNQQDIVSFLRAIPGVTVQVGHDDILVGFRGRTYWFEIKNPVKLRKSGEGLVKGTLTPAQVQLENTWAGHWEVVTTVDEILETLGLTL